MGKVIPLIGRLFLSAIFIVFGFNNIFNFPDTQLMMANAGIPFNGILLILGTILEIAGGLSVLLGYKTRWGASALMVFIIAATLLFHTRLSDQMELIQFTKNLSTLGGLLIVFALGPGPLSFDSK